MNHRLEMQKDHAMSLAAAAAMMSPRIHVSVIATWFLLIAILSWEGAIELVEISRVHVNMNTFIGWLLRCNRSWHRRGSWGCGRPRELNEDIIDLVAPRKRKNCRRWTEIVAFMLMTACLVESRDDTWRLFCLHWSECNKSRQNADLDSRRTCQQRLKWDVNDVTIEWRIYLLLARRRTRIIYFTFIHVHIAEEEAHIAHRRRTCSLYAFVSPWSVFSGIIQW